MPRLQAGRTRLSAPCMSVPKPRTFLSNKPLEYVKSFPCQTPCWSCGARPRCRSQRGRPTLELDGFDYAYFSAVTNTGMLCSYVTRRSALPATSRRGCSCESTRGSVLNGLQDLTICCVRSLDSYCEAQTSGREGLVPSGCADTDSSAPRNQRL